MKRLGGVDVKLFIAVLNQRLLFPCTVDIIYSMKYSESKMENYIMRHMFWDLEETVIESFTEPTHVNIERMRELISHFSTSVVDIFSFAIWNRYDNAIFDVKMRKSLENLYGIRIENVLVMSEVNTMYRKKTGIVLDDIDFTALLGKHGAFVEYAKIVSKGNEEFILIDDAVDNATFIFRDTNTVVHLVNVTNYEIVGLP